MLLFFKICFGVGVGYAVIGFILGHFLDLIDFDSDGIDFGGDGVDFSGDGLDGCDHLDFNCDLGDHFDAGLHHISPFKPICIASFITVMGGAGMLLYPSFGGLIALMIAATLGLIVAFLLYRFVVVPLHKAQNTSTVEIQSLIGHNATVTEKIPQGQFGKITYYVNGNTYSAPAKSETGDEILRNTNVQIAHIERNTYYVLPKTIKG